MRYLRNEYQRLGLWHDIGNILSGKTIAMKVIRSAIMSYVVLYLMKKGVEYLRRIAQSDPVPVKGTDKK